MSSLDVEVCVPLKENVDVSVLNHVYQELDKLIGTEKMLLIYHQYRGGQMWAPKRLYGVKLVKELVQRECDGHNIHQLAQQYHFSDQWIEKVWRGSKEV